MIYEATYSAWYVSGAGNTRQPVSYTHLDVYKRQAERWNRARAGLEEEATEAVSSGFIRGEIVG